MNGKRGGDPKSPLFPEGFTIEETLASTAGSVLREAPGLRVYRSGRAPGNKGASVMFEQHGGKRFQILTEAGVLWGVNEAAYQVAGRIVDPRTKGASPIRLNKQNGTYTVYLNGVFKANPLLRPAKTQWCTVSHHSDENGPYFIVHLNLAMTKGRGPKAKGEAAAETGTAPAQNQAPAAEETK